MSEIIKCPLCGEPIKHKTDKTKKTHLWVCKQCPFVGFEFYTNKDVERLNNCL